MSRRKQFHGCVLQGAVTGAGRNTTVGHASVDQALWSTKDISLKCQPSRTFCCKPRLLKCPWSRAMSNLPRGPPARVFWNSAKLGPGETTAKRRPEKTPWRQCHHVLPRISLKCQPSRTFCCKPRLLKCPWSRAMSNLPRGPPARVFWNSAKLGPGETTEKRRPEKTPWRQCHHVVTTISLKC